MSYSQLAALSFSLISELVGASSYTRSLAVHHASAVATSERIFADSSKAQDLALVTAVGYAESRYNPKVVRCIKRGDLNISAVGAVSAFQLLGPWARGGYPVKEICADPSLAAGLAIDVLRAKHQKCRGTVRELLSAYNTGRCGHNTVMVRQTCKALKKLNAGIWCGSRLGVHPGDSPKKLAVRD